MLRAIVFNTIDLPALVSPPIINNSDGDNPPDVAKSIAENPVLNNFKASGLFFFASYCSLNSGKCSLTVFCMAERPLLTKLTFFIIEEISLKVFSLS